MTLEEAYEYRERAEEHESESRAEWGSGAVSLGYDPGAWFYDGYRTSDDESYAEALRVIAAHSAKCACGTVIHEGAAECGPCHQRWLEQTYGPSDDLPF